MMAEENLDPTIASGSGEVDSGIPGVSAGTVIGRYFLVQRVGEGGMGEVWLAEQTEPVRRRVALKLIKAGMNTREVIARFESERQTLAVMDHPAIAKVFDAGSTALGAPYFVMEYVAGVPITDYCDNHKLNTRERLELFVRVCDGVQHAHQKAIIHRDLKPSNILVTEVDGKAAPKIIDFGLSKALTQRMTAEAMFTRLGALVGTPEYMSPEQANSPGEDIDTRTDVYSLGIVLYELLAGVTPIEMKRLGYEALLKALREQEAPKPSTKLRSQDNAKISDLAHKRGTEPLELTQQIRGDLDAITLKALEKDRSRRYASPSEFAADIGRYLRNDVVLATPASRGYRARKFARRNRGALITLCAFILVLVAGAGVSIWQGVQARAERDRADREAATAKAVNQFLQEDLLSHASAESQGGAETEPDPDVKVRTLLERAAAQVGKRFRNQPLVESEIRRTIGSSYKELGLYSEAEKHMRRAYELSRDQRGKDDPATLDILLDLSTMESDLGKRKDALEMSLTVLEARKRTFGPDDPKTAVAMQSAGVNYLLSDKYAQAEPLLKKALELQTRSPGYDHIETLDTSDSLATLYIFESRYAEADALLTRGLESYRRKYGPEHPFTLRETYGLGRVLHGEGKYAEAETLVAEVLKGNQRLKGLRHPDTIMTATELGDIYRDQGKFDEARAILEKAVVDSRETLGPASRVTLSTETSLGSTYDAGGDLVRAEQTWRKEIAEAFREPRSGLTPKERLGQNLTKQRRFDEAEALLRQTLAEEEKLGSDRWELFRARAFLGAALAGQRKFAEAEPLLTGGYEGLKQRENKGPANHVKWTRWTGEQLASLYEQWQKPEKAADWRKKLEGQ